VPDAGFDKRARPENDSYSQQEQMIVNKYLRGIELKKEPPSLDGG